MIEKCKDFLKKNFSNSPKAKILIGATVLVAVLTVTFINMRKTLTIRIDGEEETFVTYKGTVKDVLDSKGVEIAPKDKVQPALDNRVSEKDTISVKKAISVDLTVGEKQIQIDTAEDTIGEMLKSETEELKSQGIEFKDGVDEVSPSLETNITKDLKIQLVKVDVKSEIAKEAIAFDTDEQTDSSLDVSVEEVRQNGATGEKEVTYEVIYKDGKEVSRNIRSSKVLAEPVTKVIVRGTRQTFASRDGQVLDYKKLIYCESTAYHGDGITATGTVPVRSEGGISTIAVDPRVIPLGSLVYVEGYGKAIASDTGGAIKGNIIDVFVNSQEEAYGWWGRRYNVPVYILAYPGEW
ncbi:3D domain-containing protein [Clostridium carnis]